MRTFRSGQPTADDDEEGSKKIRVVYENSAHRIEVNRQLTSEVEKCSHQVLKGNISDEPEEVRSRQQDKRPGFFATAS